MPRLRPRLFATVLSAILCIDFLAIWLITLSTGFGFAVEKTFLTSTGSRYVFIQLFFIRQGCGLRTNHVLTTIATGQSQFVKLATSDWHFTTVSTSDPSTVPPFGSSTTDRASTSNDYVTVARTTRRTALPYWLLTAVTAIAPAAALRKLHEQSLHDQSPGHCRHCGYDLRASPTRCPECGTPVMRG